MNEQRLPKWVEPQRLAETNSQLQGHLPLSEMPRLLPLLTSHTSRVRVELNFGIDIEGISYLSGEIQASLVMACQRCLGDVSLAVTSHIKLAIVTQKTNLKALPSRYEPLVYAGEPIRLSDLIEDELILAMPQVAMHPTSECKLAQHDKAANPAPAPQRDNPFALLDQLKTK